MKQRPILFNASMVRALLDGTKTQTRRVVKPQPDCIKAGKPYTTAGLPSTPIACPYGQVGDQLWVRETWYCDDFRVQRGPYLKPDDFDVVESRENGCLVFRADGSSPYEAEQPKWKPAIHMPRWASRITLEITSVRVERLNDISRGDCMAEGCPFPNIAKETDPKQWYRELWKSINGAGSWDLNPWVWVIEFKKVKT